MEYRHTMPPPRPPKPRPPGVPPSPRIRCSWAFSTFTHGGHPCPGCPGGSPPGQLVRLDTPWTRRSHRPGPPGRPAWTRPPVERPRRPSRAFQASTLPLPLRTTQEARRGPPRPSTAVPGPPVLARVPHGPGCLEPHLPTSTLSPLVQSRPFRRPGAASQDPLPLPSSVFPPLRTHLDSGRVVPRNPGPWRASPPGGGPVGVQVHPPPPERLPGPPGGLPVGFLDLSSGGGQPGGGALVQDRQCGGPTPQGGGRSTNGGTPPPGWEVRSVSSWSV